MLFTLKEVVGQVVDSVGWDNLNGTTVKNQLEKLRGFKAQGLVNYDFTTTRHTPNKTMIMKIKNGQLVGIVTQTDLIRALTSYGMWWEVRDIMTSDVAEIQGSATVDKAAEIMSSRNISCIAVLQAGEIVGMFTEKDLIKKVIAQQKDPASIKIEQVMSSSIVSVPPACSLFSASRIMEKMNIRRLPCMENKRLCGIVTQTDIFRAIQNKLESEREKEIWALIIDENQQDVQGLQNYLSSCRKNFVKSEYVADVHHALKKIGHRHFDLIFLSNRFGGEMTVRGALETLRQRLSDVPIVIITRKDDQQSAMELMKMGAHDYIIKDNLTPDLVEKIKTSSNIWIKNNNLSKFHFEWQKGYGAFSHSRSQLDTIVKYVLNQEIHHKKKSFKEEYLEILKKNDIEFKYEYVFDFFD